MVSVRHVVGLCKVIMYAIGLLLLQIHFVSRLPYQSLRIDLLLLLIVALTVELPFSVSITAAICVGFVVDVCSGRFWGLHVTSYVITVVLVSKVLLRFEMQNPLYQMVVTGCCGLIQGGLLVVFFWMDQQIPALSYTMVASLVVRSLVMMVVAPIVIHALVGVWSEA
jgi:rod shape-determining protein MreD